MLISSGGASSRLVLSSEGHSAAAADKSGKRRLAQRIGDRRAIALAAALIASASTAMAAPVVWQGGGADANWTTGVNWVGNIAPTSATSTDVTLGVTAASAPVVDTNNPWMLDGIAYSNNHGSVTLTGNPLQFYTANNGTIINDSVTGTFADSISNNITIVDTVKSSYSIFSGASTTGNLNLSGNITTSLSGANAATVFFRGAGANSTFSGALSGPSNANIKIDRNGTGTWTFSSAANKISNVVLEQGVTKNGANNALGAVPQLNFAGAATFDLNGFNQTTGDFVSTANGGVVTNSSATASTLTDTSTSLFRAPNVAITGNLEFDEAGTMGIQLAGADTYTGATKVTAGKLFVNGTHTVTSGSTAAYTISGGTFGGNGTINLSAVNQGIAIQSGAKLSPGSADGLAGTLTAALGTGVFDISGAVSGSNTGGLVYGMAATGGTSDQVKLTSGTLNIGSGVLALNDFSFSGTLTDGTVYTLIDTNSPIVGSLSSTGLTGTVNGLTATLALSADGQDLVLAVPEPGACAMLVGIAGFAAARRRTRADKRVAR